MNLGVEGAKTVVLSSGGKDSILAMHMAHSEGYRITAMITVLPKNEESMLYHVPNVDHVGKIADAMSLRWIPISASDEYEKASLEEALRGLEEEVLITGGIASKYQKNRFGSMAESAGMKIYSPLWGMKAEEIFRRIANLNIDALVVGVAAYGLGQEWLGAHLDGANVTKLLKLAEKFKFDPTGEGGDLETFVLDAPLYAKRLVMLKALKEWKGDRGELRIEKLSLQDKRR